MEIKKNLIKWTLPLIFIIIGAAALQAQPQKNIILLATGGTIAGQNLNNASGAYRAGTLGINALIQAIPGIKSIAMVSGEQLVNISSQDMTPAIWLKLAKRVNAILANPKISGVVITHGTDTLEETAYFLQLVVKSSKPVIITGAMRPSTALSADGPKNLYDAVVLAADEQASGKGVLVVANGYVYSARDITKGHTHNVNAITASEYGPLGVIIDKKVHFYHQITKKHTTDTPFDITTIKTLPQVEIEYLYAESPTRSIQSHFKNHAEGLILAGLGDGNLPPGTLKALEQAEDCIIVRSSRTGNGYVIPNSEINDNQYGFLTANNLNPQKARVLLMLALTKTHDKNKIQNFFDQF